MTVSVCPMCGAKGVQMTEHHVHEAPLDKNGRTQTIYLCPKCHDSHNLYLMALRDNNITIDRRKLESNTNNS